MVKSMGQDLSKNIHYSKTLVTTNQLKTRVATLFGTSGGAARVPGACRSGPDVSHPSFGLLVVFPDPSLVRFETSIFFGKPSLALLYPLI